MVDNGSFRGKTFTQKPWKSSRENLWTLGAGWPKPIDSPCRNSKVLQAQGVSVEGQTNLPPALQIPQLQAKLTKIIKPILIGCNMQSMIEARSHTIGFSKGFSWECLESILKIVVSTLPLPLSK